jgi:hypothetical protein
MTQFWVSYKGKGTEGFEAEKITWRPENEKEKSPSFAVGEVVEVEFNRRGRLQFAEEE